MSHALTVCEEHPDAVRCDMVVNEGAGEVIPFDGRRVYGVCVAEKGVFRFTLRATRTAARGCCSSSRASATT